MIRITQILDKVSEYMPNVDLSLLQQAHIFAATAHEGQVRLSGEPYLSHPLSVAMILADMHWDLETIAAGLLHDTVEDTSATIEDIRESFGEGVSHIVDGVTKISKMDFATREDAQAESIRKMIVAMSKDIRVLSLKLADRLHNMRTLEYMKPHRRLAIARETLDIYAPLANRLGLYRIKVELEDLCLKYLHPEAYGQLEEGVRQHQTSSEEYVSLVVGMLEEMLKENNVEGRVNGRTKHYMSIYNKMREQKLTFDEIYDLIAFRIIVKSVRDCYAVFGFVHAKWHPVPGRIKDYISMPKENMYASLHTTVVGPGGERIEVQIRTEEMHRLAEFGVAAHWLYKEGQAGMKAKDAAKFTWLREIVDWQKETTDSQEFLSSLRYDLFSDELYVFTPSGDIKELPKDATPVDFAYQIHTQVGDHCKGAKVNGKLAQLDTKLKNGDSVEIITSPSRYPSRDWLKFVKTGKAISRIKHFIRTEERERSIALAREMLEKEGRKMGVNFVRALNDGRLETLAEEFSFSSVDELLSAVGYTRITPRKVLNRLLPKAEEEATVEPETEPVREEPTRTATDGVVIDGVDNVLVSYAQCCNPLPGEPIVGHISPTKGVRVHTAECPNVRNLEPERIINISWRVKSDHTYPGKILIKAKDAPGVLGRLGMLISEQGANIDAGSFKSQEDGTTRYDFTVMVRDLPHLLEVMGVLSREKEVLDVSRPNASRSG
ncbi:MAG: RelA/SpoT family protein [Desulfovibrio sp.]|uniref:RelA/SpoT family protein n=1 Tax=Desulfovibrio sp. 7SRBS1 TaxID=3378064 RepID=UPI003B4253B8